MTDTMLARGALERKEAWAFLVEGVRMLLASSREFRAQCREMLESGRGCLEFEEDLRGAMLGGAARGMSEVLSELDGELAAPSCGRCGSRMHRRGTRALSPLSLLGRLTLRRGYWTCRCAEGAGVHLLDRALGVAGRAGVRMTPAALRALAEEASEKSFAKAAESLGRQAGVWATAKRAERAAKQAGREIAAWDRSAPGLAEAPAETMYCSPDGTGVPMVRRDAGTGEDGQPTKTREAKVAVFHTAERRDRKTGLPERDAGSARYTAAIDSARSKDADPKPSPFAGRLWQTALRSGFAAAARQVLIGDGAKWIWNNGAELFPNAICIVDIWHACERLWEVGRTVYGAGTQQCRAWSEKACGALSEGRIKDVLRELRQHAGEPVADKAAGYFRNNRSRMRYPRYRAMGLLIGSGVVESSCGTLVAARFKRGGMRWSKAGANDILHLRACIRSGLYDDFWRQRRGPPIPAAERLAH